MNKIDEISFSATLKILQSRTSPPFYQAMGEEIHVKIGGQTLKKPRFLVVRHQIMRPPYFHYWPLRWFNGWVNYFQTQPPATYYVIDYNEPCKNVGYQAAFAAYQLFPQNGRIQLTKHYFIYVRDLNKINAQNTLADAKLTHEFYRSHIEIPFKLQSQVYFLAQRFPNEIALSEYATNLSLASRLYLAASILEAKKRLHAEGIIHQNIQPENILIEKLSDNKFDVRIVDFSCAKKINLETEINLCQNDKKAIDDILIQLLNNNKSLACAVLILHKYNALNDENLNILARINDEEFFEELFFLQENKLITPENIDLIFEFLEKDYCHCFSWKERRQMFLESFKKNSREIFKRHFQFMLSSYKEINKKDDKDKFSCAFRIYINLSLFEKGIIPKPIKLSEDQLHHYYDIINLLKDDECFNEKIYQTLNEISTACSENLKVIALALKVFYNLSKKRNEFNHEKNQRWKFFSNSPKVKDASMSKFFVTAQSCDFFKLLSIFDHYNYIDQDGANGSYFFEQYFQKNDHWSTMVKISADAMKILHERGLVDKANIDKIYKRIHGTFINLGFWFPYKVISYAKLNMLDKEKLQQIIDSNLPIIEEMTVGFRSTFSFSPKFNLSS